MIYLKPSDTPILPPQYKGTTACQFCHEGIHTYGKAREHLLERHNKIFDENNPSEYIIAVWMPR